jgi:hypothetical protein
MCGFNFFVKGFAEGVGGYNLNGNKKPKINILKTKLGRASEENMTKKKKYFIILCLPRNKFFIFL